MRGRERERVYAQQKASASIQFLSFGICKFTAGAVFIRKLTNKANRLILNQNSPKSDKASAEN